MKLLWQDHPAMEWRTLYELDVFGDRIPFPVSPALQCLWEGSFRAGREGYDAFFDVSVCLGHSPWLFNQTLI